MFTAKQDTSSLVDGLTLSQQARTEHASQAPVNEYRSYQFTNTQGNIMQGGESIHTRTQPRPYYPYN